VFAAIQQCRNEWKRAVVDMEQSTLRDRRPDYEAPFQARWDFADAPELLASVAPRLAAAGYKLFVSIFELNCDEELPKLAAALRGLLSKPRCINIISNDLFVPWSMLYTQPPGKEPLAANGSNWEASGFWGYQHIVHHSPTHFKFEGRIEHSPPFSINFDDRLLVTQPPIKNHINKISALAGKSCIFRTTKAELALALTQPNRLKLERILYFYCHGYGSSTGDVPSTDVPHLSLKDGDVDASDFDMWAIGAPLPTRALIMINACQGGQITTLFYESFAKRLLEEGAVGLIGAQIDVPTIFASAYGELLLQQFLARNNSVRLGPLMRSVNQTMWNTHKNPLGLIYSLYRGVDCFIDWAHPA
jgi:hypothetical protein